MSINEVRYLPECGSTNAYMKEHFEEFGPVGAVYTTNQTAGRGRLGRTSSTEPIACPPSAFQESGLWQNRQRRGQPCKNST